MAKVRRNLIATTLAVSCLTCVLCMTSLSTNNWLTATAELSARLSNVVNYGLFRGSLERHQLAAKLQFDLNVVCDFSQAACMYSCQRSDSQRQDELGRLLVGAELMPCEQVRHFLPLLNHTFHVVLRTDTTTDATEERYLFMPAPVWLCAVIFTCFCAIFNMAAAGFTLLNLYTNPVERIFNIFGLYIWNGASASCGLMALSAWVVLFYSHLRHNIAITDTLRREFAFSSNGSAILGFSFYAQLGAFLLSLVNLLLLFLRRQMMLRAAAPATITLEPRDTPLQFY